MNKLKKAKDPNLSLSCNQVRTVLDLNRKLHDHQAVPALLTLISKEAAQMLNAERASIFLLDKEQNELWSQVALSSPPIRFDARLGIAGAAALSGKIINVPDARKDPRFFPTIDVKSKFQTRSVLAIPMRKASGEVIGTFQILNKHGRAFSAADEAVGQALAEQAAMALDTAQWVESVQRHRQQLEQETSHLRKEVEGRFATQKIMGISAPIQGIIRLIDQIRDTSVGVLITGENGTGKDLIAKAIHFNSPQAGRPLVALNCAALPDHLIESELFGIEKGVATGVEARIGKFQQAHGGTLFLDEIGNMSMESQAKILRALEERKVEPIGGRVSIPVDVRILAATNKNLEDAIANGEFREDLYYRLKVIHIHTPALRDIPEDIPLLANYFLGKYSRELGVEPKRFEAGALQVMQRAPWPGNIRQLENEVKRLVVMVRGNLIREKDLDSSLVPLAPQPVASHPGQLTGTLKQTLEATEKKIIQETLQACHYHQGKTAKILGLSRQGLIKKLNRYGLLRP